MNQYEAMFLFDPTFGGSIENCEAEIRRLMERADGEIVFCKKWDERRLAYRINGRKRGVYMLVYFKAPADKIVGLERDVKLSENVLRVLVLRADEVTPERMEQAVTVQPVVEGSGKPGEGSPASPAADGKAKAADAPAAVAAAEPAPAAADSEPAAAADSAVAVEEAKAEGGDSDASPASE